MNHHRTTSLRFPAHVGAIALGAATLTASADPITPGRPAVAAPRFALLLPGKSPEPIALLRLSSEPDVDGVWLTYLDSAGARTSTPLDSVVAIAPISWIPTPESVAPPLGERSSEAALQRIELTDGQRLVGQIIDPSPEGAGEARAPAGGAMVSVRSERLGVVAFPIERVRRIHADAPRAPVPGDLSAAADTLVLVNGDRIEGFIESIGPRVRIEPAADRTGPRPPAQTIELEQIELANLINPPVPPRGGRVDLVDGSILAVDLASISAQLESGKCAFRPLLLSSNAPLSRDLGDLAGLIPSASRLIPLSDLTITAQRPHASAPRTPAAAILADAPAPLSTADILLPGPMTIEWSLPESVSSQSSISGYAQMDDRSFAWGDCEITVSIIAPGAPVRELAKGRLSAESPTLPLASELGAAPRGSRLRVQVEPGEHGPIQDRVVLRRMLLIAPTASE